MTATMLELAPEEAAARGMPGVRLFVLARVACEDGASRAELARDIGPCLGAGGGRLAIEAELARLIRSGLATELKARFSSSATGLTALGGELGSRTLPRVWSEMRDARLVAKALGLEREAPARIKALARPETLRAAILAQTYGLKVRGAVSFSKLRAALAMAALERAFGNKIKGELSASAAFNAKASRVLAGQLLKKPRDAGTDKRLIALLAAEAVDCAKPDGDALRLALLRRLASSNRPASPPKCDQVAPAANSVSPASGLQVPAVPSESAKSLPVAVRPAAASRPDLPGFVTVVRQLALDHAEGWPGNRKALVSRVFKSVTAAHAVWGLTLVEFKAMLAECHRTGHLALSTADLKDKRDLDELRESAIAYKNTVWHLVRLDG